MRQFWTVVVDELPVIRLTELTPTQAWEAYVILKCRPS